METHEEKIEGLPASPREKDGSKAMETTAQEILHTTKKLKEGMEFLGDAQGPMPEERKKSFKKSSDFNNNTELAVGRTPNALEPDDSPISQDRQKHKRFIDRATSPVKLMQSEFEVKRGTPTSDELQNLGAEIAEKWEKLGRRLGVSDASLTEIDHARDQLSEKGYSMLKLWRESKGFAATYQALCDALQDQLVQRRDMAERFCYIEGKEVVEAEKDRMPSGRVKQIVSNMTAGFEQRLKKLESQPESIRKKVGNRAMKTRVHEILETTVKQPKDVKESIEHSMEDVEVVEKELGKERDQMDDLEKMQEERKTSFEKSSDCNNNTVLNKTASCENELAADRAPNALESDDFPVSLDRQENMGVLDRVTPTLKPMQSKPEGNQICSWCHKLEKELGALKGEMEQIKLRHNEEKTLEAEKFNRKAKLREANERHDIVQEYKLGEAIAKEIGEKKEIESRLLSEMSAVKIELAQVTRKNVRLTREIEKLKKIKGLKNPNKALATKNKNHRSKIKTEECDTVTNECADLTVKLNRLSTELEQVRIENKSLEKENKDFRHKISELETKNKNHLSKVKTETGECDKLKTERTALYFEKEQLAKANNKSLEEIKDLKTENNSLESEIKTKECEIKRIRKECGSIAKANADSIQKIEVLEGKIKALEKKNDRYRALLPRGEHFQSPGAISTIGNDGLAKVVASRSSEGPGQADDVFNRRLSKDVNCGTKEIRGSWWCVDLGKNYLLVPTHYSLRHGKKEGDSILRHWKLQGSIDGEDWKDIDTHRRKEDFTKPFPYATDTWSVEGEVRAFRYFKIVQTGRHSSNWYGIYLSGMEFYGVLLKV